MAIMKKVSVYALLIPALAACAQGPAGSNSPYGVPALNKETAGTLLGGAAGAWAGSSVGKGSGRVLATAAGAIIGGLVGNQIGSGLDQADRLRAERTAQQALETAPSGRAVRWSNPDNGRYGEVVPGPAYSDSGRSCRPYTQTIYIDGQAQAARGTACRNPDGSWTTGA